MPDPRPPCPSSTGGGPPAGPNLHRTVGATSDPTLDWHARAAETVLHQLVGGLRSSMGYLGCTNIDRFRSEATFVRITNAGVRESHAHDIQITKEAPNYKLG